MEPSGFRITDTDVNTSAGRSTWTRRPFTCFVVFFWGGAEEDTEVRLEPQKSWDVTRMETPRKITSSKSKSREADAETDEDLKGWRDGYIR